MSKNSNSAMTSRDFVMVCQTITILVFIAIMFMDWMNNRRQWKAIISIAKNCDAVDKNEVATWSCLTNHMRISNENFKLVEHKMVMDNLRTMDFYPPSQTNDIRNGLIIDVLKD